MTDAERSGWARHPVDILQELIPDADPERLAQARAICDELVPTFAWIEIDCPGCGIDFDIEPSEIGPDLGCGCGAMWTREVLAEGNAYGPEGQIVDNPFQENEPHARP